MNAVIWDVWKVGHVIHACVFYFWDQTFQSWFYAFSHPNISNRFRFWHEIGYIFTLDRVIYSFEKVKLILKISDFVLGKNMLYKVVWIFKIFNSSIIILFLRGLVPWLYLHEWVLEAPIKVRTCESRDSGRAIWLIHVLVIFWDILIFKLTFLYLCWIPWHIVSERWTRAFSLRVTLFWYLYSHLGFIPCNTLQKAQLLRRVHMISLS